MNILVPNHKYFAFILVSLLITVTISISGAVDDAPVPNVMLRVVRVTPDWIPFASTDGWTQAVPLKESEVLKFYEVAIWEETSSVHLYEFPNNYDPLYGSSVGVTDAQKIAYREQFLQQKYTDMPDAWTDERSLFLKSAFMGITSYLVNQHPNSEHHLMYNGHGGPGGGLFELQLHKDHANEFLDFWSQSLGKPLGVVDMGGPCTKGGFADLDNFCEYARYYVASDLPNGGYTMDVWTFEKFQETDPETQYHNLFAANQNLEDVLIGRIDLKRKAYEYSRNNMITNHVAQVNYLYSCDAFRRFSPNFIAFFDSVRVDYPFNTDLYQYMIDNEAPQTLIEQFNDVIVHKADNKDFFQWSEPRNGILMPDPEYLRQRLASLNTSVEIDVKITVPGNTDLVPDPNLAVAVRETLGLGPNALINAQAMQRLTELEVSKDNQIKDLTGLEHATNLETLGLFDHQITDVSPLAGLTNLTWLGLAGNQIRDISPLAGLTQLTDLQLQDNQISDIRPLAQLIQLETLSLVKNQIQDITPLAGLTRLQELRLIQNNIRDVSPLAGLEYLKWLYLNDNQVQDVSLLVELVNLEILQLSGNPVTNTAPLRALLRQNPNLQIDIDVSIARAERVLIYTGSTWWINPSDAIGEAETAKDLLQSAGIHVEITQNEDYVKQWMLQTTSDGSVDVIIFYGILPNTIYPPENAMPDGSVVENWIETTDGNTILNHADYLGYWSTNINDLNELVYLENGARTLQNLMDNSSIFIPVESESGNIPMFVTTDGSTLTPSLVNFESDRPIRLDQLQGDWFPEKILASSTRDTQATWVDPVVLRDGNRGRIAIVHQTEFEDNPIGEVAAELIINYLLAAPVILVTDINNDGEVNIQDLVLIASSLGETGENAADVNGDEIVDIRDLIDVAAALDTPAAAPSLDPRVLSMFTTANVRKWLSEAQHLNLTDPTTQKGIRFLEQLLTTLIPKTTALLPNYPNPFNPETWVPYKLAKSADVTLTIYAVNGQIVRQMPLGHQSAGTYQSKSRAVYWDGKNAVGEPVASGLYFYTLTADNFTATRKMLIRK